MCCESDQPSLTQAGHRRGQLQLLAALSAIVFVWFGFVFFLVVYFPLSLWDLNLILIMSNIYGG